MDKRGIAVILIVWVMVSGSAMAGDQVVDPKIGLPLFLKIITYDDNFRHDDLKAVRVHVVYDKRLAQSFAQFREIETYCREKTDVLVQGLPLELVPLPVTMLDSALKHISPEYYNLLLVTSVGDHSARELLRSTQERGLRSFALDPEYVALGLAVGVRPNKNKPSIVVNLESSRKEGSKFSAHLLKLCEIL